MKTVRFARCLGLNTVRSPAALVFDLQTGSYEASCLVNVWLDQLGRPFTRPGCRQVGTVALRSLWSDGIQAYAASDETLYRVESDWSLTALQTGLANGRLRFAKAETRVFWVNGVEKGSLFDGEPLAWGGAAYPYPETRRVLSEPPVGHLLAYFAGRLWIAVENVVYWTEPAGVSLDFVALGESLMPPFGSRVGMLHPVADGLYVGTETDVWFVAGLDIGKFQYQRVMGAPAIEGTDVDMDGLLLGQAGAPGLAAIWTSPRGVCVGLPEGVVRNVTERTVVIPPSRRGSAAMIDNKYHVLLEQ